MLLARRRPLKSIRLLEAEMVKHRVSSDGRISRRLLKVLVVDVGGTNLKVLATGKRVPRKVSSGPNMTARQMVQAA